VAPEVLETHTTVRRVCRQMGVQTFRQPNRQARIAEGVPDLPSHLGGGLYVQLTGRHANGYVQVRTLKGAEVWIREVERQSGIAPLCAAPASVMRVCRNDTAPQPVPVHADYAAPDAVPIAWIEPGSLIQLWGYFEDHGRWTFVETHGKVGFVRSDELCHAKSTPPSAQATEHFGMIAAPATPDCYQWGRERDRVEIRRIVIHNSETTLKGTIAKFRACAPERPTSAHVGIDRDGKIYRFVEDKFTAFHTGGTEGSGGFNAMSLGIELIASGQPGFALMTPAQERALVRLIRFWANEYHLTIRRNVLQNSTRAKSYNDLEYWNAPVSIHRLVSAGRRTDCPKFIWADSVQGDEAFFRWRRKHLGQPSDGPLPSTPSADHHGAG
jgi:hypothetical protein